MALHLREPCMESSATGVDAEFISDDVMDLKDKMKNSLVGFFVGDMPNFCVFRAALQRYWHSKQGFGVQTFNHGFFL